MPKRVALEKCLWSQHRYRDSKKKFFLIHKDHTLLVLTFFYAKWSAVKVIIQFGRCTVFHCSCCVMFCDNFWRLSIQMFVFSFTQSSLHAACALYKTPCTQSFSLKWSKLSIHLQRKKKTHKMKQPIHIKLNQRVKHNDLMMDCSSTSKDAL